MWQHHLMNSNHCWVGAVFGIELMLVNLETPNCPSASGMKELRVLKHHNLVLFMKLILLCLFQCVFLEKV